MDSSAALSGAKQSRQKRGRPIGSIARKAGRRVAPNSSLVPPGRRQMDNCWPAGWLAAWRVRPTPSAVNHWRRRRSQGAR